jgi:acetylxylan esterase
VNERSCVEGTKNMALTLAVAIFTLCLPAAAEAAGQVQQVASFGDNPSGIGMYIYTPSKVVAKPPILVGIHACHGKGTDVCSPNNAFAQQADNYGFLLVCPSAVSSDGCWDIHSTKVLTHDGGGDATGIISMVKYAIQNKNGDGDRVYAAGHSSGGMMTNIMLGSYPDVFKAGAAYAGVPFGCYAQGTVDSLGWNTSCATGKVTMTGEKWGDLVRAAYPGFTGTRPRMQLWHGTKDETVNFQNFKEEIKQWANVLGVSETPTTTENNAIKASWIRTRYADNAGVVQVEAIEETNQPHNLDVNAAEAIKFFGLDGSNLVLDAGAKDSGKDAPAGTGGKDGGGGTDGSGGRTGSGGSGGSGGITTITGGKGGDSGGGGRGGSGGGGGNGGRPDAGVKTDSSPPGTGGSTGVGSGGSGIGGSGGTGTSAKNGGSTGQGTSETKDNTSGCSCDMGADRRHPGGIWLVGLLLVGFSCRHRSQSVRRRSERMKTPPCALA